MYFKTGGIIHPNLINFHMVLNIKGPESVVSCKQRMTTTIKSYY